MATNAEYKADPMNNPGIFAVTHNGETLVVRSPSQAEPGRPTINNASEAWAHVCDRKKSWPSPKTGKVEPITEAEAAAIEEGARLSDVRAKADAVKKLDHKKQSAAPAA